MEVGQKIKTIIVSQVTEESANTVAPCELACDGENSYNGRRHPAIAGEVHIQLSTT